MKLVNIVVTLLIGLIFVSCHKSEGEGGTSTIKGKVYIENYNSVGSLVGEYDGAEEDVYIIYGETSTTYNDKFETSFDGSFEFNFLAKGKYRIFAYEDCDTCASGKIRKEMFVDINDNKSTVDVGTIILRK